MAKLPKATGDAWVPSKFVKEYFASEQYIRNRIIQKGDKAFEYKPSPYAPKQIYTGGPFSDGKI